MGRMQMLVPAIKHEALNRDRLPGALYARILA